MLLNSLAPAFPGTPAYKSILMAMGGPLSRQKVAKKNPKGL